MFIPINLPFPVDDVIAISKIHAQNRTNNFFVLNFEEFFLHTMVICEMITEITSSITKTSCKIESFWCCCAISRMEQKVKKS